MIATRMTELIGETPSLRLTCLQNSWQLLLKLEKFNPGGSMKDRMALSMVATAERSGQLRPGGTIVESTSGNTGLGLAMIAAERGYGFIAVVDRHAAADKLRIMRALGAQLQFVGAEGSGAKIATGEREAEAARIAASVGGAVLMAQHENFANPSGYEDTLARDLVEQVGHIDFLLGAVGTGGSLCGVARGLRKLGCKARVIGVEPQGSVVFGGPGAPYYQSGTGVPADVPLGTIIDYELFDEGCTVSDIAAFNTCRFLAHRFALLVGGSAGGVIYAAVERLRSLTGTGTMVVLVGDGGERYLDTIFDDAWMEERSLLDLGVEADLAGSLAPVDRLERTHAAA